MRTLTHSSISNTKTWQQQNKKSNTRVVQSYLSPAHTQQTKFYKDSRSARKKIKIKFKISEKKPSERKKDRSTRLQKQQHPLSPLQQVRSEQVERRWWKRECPIGFVCVCVCFASSSLTSRWFSSLWSWNARFFYQGRCQANAAWQEVEVCYQTLAPPPPCLTSALTNPLLPKLSYSSSSSSPPPPLPSSATAVAPVAKLASTLLLLLLLPRSCSGRERGAHGKKSMQERERERERARSTWKEREKQKLKTTTKIEADQ